MAKNNEERCKRGVEKGYGEYPFYYVKEQNEDTSFRPDDP
jgi:hypothetical protein